LQDVLFLMVSIQSAVSRTELRVDRKCLQLTFYLYDIMWWFLDSFESSFFQRVCFPRICFLISGAWLLITSFSVRVAQKQLIYAKQLCLPVAQFVTKCKNTVILE